MANRNEEEEHGNRPACAACKYQRKRCMPDCVLRRHFPASRAEDFKAVHKIFGIANVIKMMKEVNPKDQEEVAKSLIWDAKTWAEDPVRGPHGCCMRLEHELHELREYVNSLRLLQDMGPLAMPVVNGFPWQNGTASFRENVHVNCNGHGSLIEESDVNGYANTFVQESHEREGSLADPFVRVDEISQSMGSQEVQPTFFPNGGNAVPSMFPRIRPAEGISGAEWENNCMTGHQSKRYRLWNGGQVNENPGSSVSVHFLGPESGNRATRNGPNQARSRQLDVSEAIFRQHNMSSK